MPQSVERVTFTISKDIVRARAAPRARVREGNVRENQPKKTKKPYFRTGKQTILIYRTQKAISEKQKNFTSD